MTALALVGDAPVLLADEPTTGLDRDLVAATADELRRHTDHGRAVLLITHDVAAAQRVADRVAVMYAGRIVEVTDAATFFGDHGPRHPYARRLLDALPERAFAAIPGMPPELGDLPAGCAFAPRCVRSTWHCDTVPRPRPAEGGGWTACHHPVPRLVERGDTGWPAARTSRADGGAAAVPSTGALPWPAGGRDIGQGGDA